MRNENYIGVMIIMFVCVVVLNSCKDREEKYCYYKDYRSYVHKQFFLSSKKKLAIKAKEKYLELEDDSVYEFKNACVREGISFLKAKKKGEILRYYPDLGIAKVLFRFTNEELNAPARIDVRRRSYYVPILLLHDTLPKVDTVKYMPY
nr:hypothetical protein [uncultured Marinifilum sp.]